MSHGPWLEHTRLGDFLGQHLYLTPLEAAALGFLLLPFVLLIWCSFARTLRIARTKENPTGHGFLSPINSYMLIIPLLDYAIVSYYRVFDQTLCNLSALGMLRGGPDEFASALLTAHLGWLFVGVFIIASALAMFISRWPRIKRLPYTNWHCKKGNPRIISYYFHFALFGIQGTIFGTWLICHFVGWSVLAELLDVTASRFSPDKMFGLSALSSVVWHSYGVMLCATLLVAFWLTGVRLTNREDQITGNPGRVAGLVILLITGPAVVLAPLFETHFRVDGIKRDAQVQLAVRIDGLAVGLQNELNRGAPNVEGAVKSLNAADDLYKRIDESSTWPISLPLLGSFAGFLNPLLVPIATKYGKTLRNRVWPKTSVSLPKPSGKSVMDQSTSEFRK